MTGHPSAQGEPPQWLEIGDGEARRKLACLVQPGEGPPVIWLGGFRSDMRATKAEALADWALSHGRGFIRFDYAGHGESGSDFARWTLSDWRDNALAVIAAHCRQPPVLVGSSMGGWIALLAARQLLGTALAPADPADQLAEITQQVRLLPSAMPVLCSRPVSPSGRVGMHALESR